jgi:G3E family GTPase
MFDLPITIVAGYLGSGKTTYINQRLNQPNGVRYGVLVNDFGSLNVDAELIDASDGVSVALENGCVCCSLEGGMEQAAEKLRTIAQDIDWVLLEASGVADPTRLSDRVRSWPGFELKETLTLVDAARIKKLTTDKFIGGHIKKQLHEAETLYVTKRDLISTTQATELKQWLEQQRKSDKPNEDDISDHPQFRAEQIDIREPLVREDFESWLSQLDATTLRLKGFVQFTDHEQQTYVLQWVNGEWSLATSIATKSPKPGLIRITLAGQASSVLTPLPNNIQAAETRSSA